jgi:hypothetical protein
MLSIKFPYLKSPALGEGRENHLGDARDCVRLGPGGKLKHIIAHFQGHAMFVFQIKKYLKYFFKKVLQPF